MAPRRSYQVWTAAQEAELFERLQRGEVCPQIALAMKRPVRSVELKAKKMGGHRAIAAGYVAAPFGVGMTREIRQNALVTVYAPIESADEPEDQFLDRVLNQTDAAVAHKRAERFATIRVLSDEPIRLSLSSDWHLSAKGPSWARGLIEYAEAIAGSKNTYAVAVGDMTDNPIKWKPSGVKEVPDDLRLLDLVLRRFNGKLVGMTSGNHDDWTSAVAGLDALQDMAGRHQIHYAPDELVWLVEIASPSAPKTVTARWVVATRHQYYRHSNLNYTHSCWRWLEDGANNWPNDRKGHTLLPDVLAIGHNHVASVEHRVTERGTVIGCRMGAWQYTSRHTRQGGWSLMPAMAPTIVLPNIRDGVNQPHAFERWQDALAYTITPKP